MDTDVEKLETQLELWRLQIDGQVARTQVPGVQAGFDALMRIDELKALHAIARSKLDAFKAGEESRRARLIEEMRHAWSELDAAFRNPTHRRLR